MNRRFDFEWEFRNFKIQTIHTDSNNKNSPIKRGCPLELIKYFDDAHDSYYTVALWELDKEDGYELHFVGNRPFSDISPEEIASIWVQLRAAQAMLDEYFQACDTEEQLEYW